MAAALEEKYIEKIAKEKNITLPQAMRKVDQCIKNVAATTNKDYNEIYNIIFSEEFMMECLLDSGGVGCDRLTLEQCQKACHCAIFLGKCISRQIPDASVINSDPDKYVLKMSTEKLEELVKLAAFLYYNYEGGGLTDNSYNALEYQLNKRLKLKGRRYEKIGAEPIERIRTRIPYPMASLNKMRVTEGTFFDFLKNAPDGKIVYSLKLDGVSGMAIYEGGKLQNLYTRGDGEIGGDVSYLKDYVLIPKEIPVKTKIVVRGEFILPKKVWNEKFKGSYSNPRSFVAGKINSGFIAPGIDSIWFVAYDLMVTGEKPNLPIPSRGFKTLVALGFEVPENGVFENVTAFEIVEKYREKKNTADFVIDGLVLAYDVENPAFTSKTRLENPKNKVAFKMELEEQLRKTKAISVEWNISRYGRYVPVCIFESVYIDGVRIHRASAHNAKHVQDWSLGPGTVLTVKRAGDVIPQIHDVEVNRQIPPSFPIPRGPEYSWSWKGSDIVLNNIDDNVDVKIARNIHFIEVMGVRGVGEGTVKKLFEAGFKTIQSITNAKMDEFRKLKGFADKRTANLYNGLHAALRSAPLDRYLEASTTFNSGIGRKLAKDLFRAIPNLLDMTSSEISSRLKKTKVPGFGPKRIDSVSEGMPKFRVYLDSINKDDIKVAIDNHIRNVDKLKRGDVNKLVFGKTFVFSGFYGHLDMELEDYLYNNGADFSSEVTDQTSCVVAASLANITSKMTEAFSRKIPVYTVEEFARAFKVDLAKFKKDDDEGEGADANNDE